MGNFNCRNCKCNKEIDEEFEEDFYQENNKYDTNVGENLNNKNENLKDKIPISINKNIINENIITVEGTVPNYNIKSIEVNNTINDNKNLNEGIDINNNNINKNDINDINKQNNNLNSNKNINLNKIDNNNDENKLKNNQNQNKDINIEILNNDNITPPLNQENKDYMKEKEIKLKNINRNINNIFEDGSSNMNISNPENTQIMKKDISSIFKNKEIINLNSSNNISNNNIQINNPNQINNNNKNSNNNISLKKKIKTKIQTKLKKEKEPVDNLRNKRKDSKGKNSYQNESSDIRINVSDRFQINNSLKNIKEYDIGNINFGINLEEEKLTLREQKLYEEVQKHLEQFYPPDKSEINLIHKNLEKISLKTILTDEKLNQILKDENTIIYHGELNKLINYEINPHSKMYSNRFCLLTSNNFKYYKSKAQFLRNLNPLCIIPFKNILRVNFGKIKKTSNTIDHIIICNKRGVIKHNNDDSTFKHLFENIENTSFLNSPENNESLLIFTSDNIQNLYKWFMLIQFMIERYRKNNTTENKYNEKENCNNKE